MKIWPNFRINSLPKMLKFISVLQKLRARTVAPGGGDDDARAEHAEGVVACRLGNGGVLVGRQGGN